MRARICVSFRCKQLSCPAEQDGGAPLRTMKKKTTKRKKHNKERKVNRGRGKKRKIGVAMIIIIYMYKKYPISGVISLVLSCPGSRRRIWTPRGVGGRWGSGAGGRRGERDASITRWRCCSLAFRASLLWLAAGGGARKRLTTPGPRGAFTSARKYSSFTLLKFSLIHFFPQVNQVSLKAWHHV